MVSAFNTKVREITDFQKRAIKNSTDELVMGYYTDRDENGELIPSTIVYLSQSIDRKNKTQVMAWVVAPGFTVTMRLTPGPRPVVAVRTEFEGDDGKIKYLYRTVSGRQKASVYFAKYHTEGMDRALPEALGNFYVDFFSLGNEIIEECKLEGAASRITPIDFAKYGLVPFTPEEKAKRIADAQALYAAIAAGEAPDNTPAETPEAKAERERRQQGGQRTPMATAPVVEPACTSDCEVELDYDPFAAQAAEEAASLLASAE